MQSNSSVGLLMAPRGLGMIFATVIFGPMIGYTDVFFLSAITSVLVIPVIFLIRRPAARSGH